MSHSSFRFVLRCAVALSGVVVLAGCTAGMPQRRPGSNITLPRPAGSDLLRTLLLPCDESADVKDRARAVVDCKRSLDPRPVSDPQRTASAPMAP